MRDLEYLWTDDSCNSQTCPALYRTEGGYVVQGKTLDEETLSALRNLGADETGVFVPANVLDRLIELRNQTA